MSRGGSFRPWKPELWGCGCLRCVGGMAMSTESQSAFVPTLIVCLHLVNACPAGWAALKRPAVTTGQGLVLPFHSLLWHQGGYAPSHIPRHSHSCWHGMLCECLFSMWFLAIRIQRTLHVSDSGSGRCSHSFKCPFRPREWDDYMASVHL